MRRTTHLLSGMAVGAVATSLLGLESFELYLVGAAFGLLPDLDLLLSGFGRRVHRSVVSHSLMASSLMALSWAAIVFFVGSTNSLPSLSEIPLLESVAVAFVASFVHTLEDSITLYGCRTMYPISRRIYRGPAKYDDLTANVALSVVSVLIILVSHQLDLAALF